MDFFNSLTLDLKLLVVGIAGSVLLALFSGNHKSERRYVVILAALAAVSVYRFTHTTAFDDQGEGSVMQRPVQSAVVASPMKIPLVSTSAK